MAYRLPLDLLEALHDYHSPSPYNCPFRILADDPRRSVPTCEMYYVRPWRNTAPTQSGTSNIMSDKHGFKVNLDVQQFRPEEISVKVVDDYIVVEGKHEERKDEHGFVSRQFTRRYLLPSDIEKEALESHLSSDGVLTLVAPKKEEVPPPSNERVIPIVQTNAPAMKHQSDRKTGDGDGQQKMES